MRKRDSNCGCDENPMKDCIQCNTTPCMESDPCNHSKYDCECSVRIGTDCVNYSGPDMEDTRIKNGDILTDVILKQRSQIENAIAYLENKLNLQNIGKGLLIYKGENSLGFKEFRTIESTGSVTLKYSQDNGSVVIDAPLPITYGVKTNTKNFTLIQKIEKPTLVVDTYLKGINKSASVDISDNGTDLTVSVNEVYINNLIKRQIDPAVDEVSKELERILKEITEKIETFERLVDRKVEEATNELNRIIENILKEIEALGVVELSNRVTELEEKMTFLQPGLVFMWNKPLNTIPKGFKECTDLRGRIPVGLLTTNAKFNTLGKVGGADSVTLTIEQMPEHTHTGTTNTAGEHEHGMFVDRPLRTVNGITNMNQNCLATSDGTGWRDRAYGIRSVLKGTYTPNAGATAKAGGHTHSISLNKAGGRSPIDITNPYRVINFIEYIG